MKKSVYVLFLIGVSFLFIIVGRSIHTDKTLETGNIDQIVQSNTLREFEIIFIPKKLQGIQVIKQQDESIEYTTYAYNGEVEININGEIMSLTTALDRNEITTNDILSQAEEDINKGIIYGDIYKDGGSRYYQYPEYSIIKCNTLDGNQNMYIGNVSMNINDYAIDSHIQKTTVYE